MDANNSASPLWYRKSRPLGQVRRRVQDLRIPSSFYYDFTAGRPRLGLSHNESARLAADCLLSHGLEGYQEFLKAEGEVDFLSELDKNYILDNGRDGNTGDTSEPYEEDVEFESLYAGCYSCSSLSADSESTVGELKQSSLKDVGSIDPILDDPSVEVFFQSDSCAAGMKDLVRQFISKAKLALAIVMDCFSDTELLCDLLEASRKRNVSVHLLLDHLNVNLFLNMWQELKLNSINFPKLSVRSVHGQTYCAKTGRKLTGQMSESFIITDWTEVLTGSYSCAFHILSFTWLSWQVHRSLAVLIKGSSVSSFNQEFHRLCSRSEPVTGFVNFITVPQTLCLSSNSHTVQSSNSKQRSNKDKTASLWSVEDCDKPEPAKSLLCDGNQNVRADTGSRTQTKPLQLHQSGAEKRMQHTVGAVCTQLDGRSNVEPLGRNQVDCHSNPISRTLFSEVQSQLTSITFSPTMEKNLTVQAAAMAAHLRPQLQADSTLFQIGASAKKHLQIYTYQQMNPPPRLNWTPLMYKSAGPRTMMRHNSFSGTHVTGQLGWRSIQSNITASVGRSQSVTDRRAAGLHLNAS